MDAKPRKKPALRWVAIALLLGMLIWVRLRLVTDIPRAAYADPEASQASDGEPAHPDRASLDLRPPEPVPPT